MRNMSFALTTEQIRNRSKTVTRRLNWMSLKPGQLIRAVVKGMGLRKGQKPEEIAILRIISVRRERLGRMRDGRYGNREVKKEGFEMTPDSFLRMFCRHMHCPEDQRVTRIEFRYVPGGAAVYQSGKDFSAIASQNPLPER